MVVIITFQICGQEKCKWISRLFSPSHCIRRDSVAESFKINNGFSPFFPSSHGKPFKMIDVNVIKKQKHQIMMALWLQLESSVSS